MAGWSMSMIHQLALDRLRLRDRGEILDQRSLTAPGLRISSVRLQFGHYRF